MLIQQVITIYLYNISNNDSAIVSLDPYWTHVSLSEAKQGNPWQFVSVGVVFRRDMSYQRVLEKCISVVFPTSTPGDEYYIANGRGMPICDADCIRMDNEKGIEEKVPWTLETYIKLSHIRYASKARFYCVKRSTGTLVIIYNLYM